MKQHKDKDVWAHRPDALPLPDAPSTGARRKKGPLTEMRNKHLWDHANQAMKELKADVDRMAKYGVPTSHKTGPLWVSADCDLAIWRCEALERVCARLDEVLVELEGRMRE